MIYSVLIYLILVLPLSIRSYKKDGKKYIFNKIFNSLITLYIFVLLSGNLWRLTISITNKDYLIMKDVPLSLNIAYSLVYALFSFFIIIQLVRLTLRKELARKSILLLIPFLWILLGIHKYYGYYNVYNKTPTLLHILVSNTISAVILGGIYLFYYSKKTKEFFNPPR